MEDVYKPPKSILLQKEIGGNIGQYPPVKAIFISPLGAPIVWFLLITLVSVASNDGGLGSGLIGFLTTALIIPVVVSYVLTIVIGGPLYFLLFKFKLTSFWIFNAVVFLVILILGILLAIIEKEIMGAMLALCIAIAAFINTSFMWYLTCKPSNKCGQHDAAKDAGPLL